MLVLALKVGLLLFSTIAVILWLTQFSLRTFGVPEDQHMIAGIVVALAFELLSSPILALLVYY